jgi:signal transduction histidine kinase
MRLKDDFLATLSHELRTPMNAILGWLAILQNGSPVRDARSALAVVQRNAEVQAKLIDDLLDMTRLMSGNIQLDLSPVDLAAIVQTTVEALQPAADAKGVQLLARVDSGVRSIAADARRLQQVLWNVLHNSVKFTPEGGRVEVRLQEIVGGAEISVSDTGRGISPAFLPHVFDRFRQQDSSPTRDTSGLGLGLSIAKHLVELHGGTIEAQSAGIGAGATFIVRLPAAISGPERPVTLSESIHAAGGQSSPFSLSAARSSGGELMRHQG